MSLGIIRLKAWDSILPKMRAFHPLEGI